MSTSDNQIQQRGLMLVLSSPSGAGKTTIAKKLLDQKPSMKLSVSNTTRAPRPNEVDGKDYRFCTVEHFESLREQGEFLESAKVFGNYYGTPRTPVENALSKGEDILFDIDWQGTQQLAQRMGEGVISIFVLPPSIRELERRLQNRAEDSEDVIQDRMSQAAREISHWAEYDYVIINECLEKTLRNIEVILKAERLRRSRQKGLSAFVQGLMASEEML